MKALVRAIAPESIYSAMSRLKHSLRRTRRAIRPTVSSAVPTSQPAGFFVPQGQSIYDPMVLGVYDLKTQTVIPKQGAFPQPTNLDIAAKRAQHYQRLSKRSLDTSRYNVALRSLEPGRGICLDACTPVPVEIVKATIEKLGYTYKAIDIGPGTPEVRKEDLQALSFADNSIDQIFSCDTLEHIPDYKLALRELYRVLKSEGFAVIHMPVYYFDRPEGEPIRPGVDPWDHTRYFSAREVIDAALAAGFALLRTNFCFDYGALVLVLGKHPKLREAV
jgi:SAM-dependent methyltransferase